MLPFAGRIVRPGICRSLVQIFSCMHHPILVEIAKKIRSLRQAQNLTLHEVAERADVSKSLLSKVENGRTVPSLPVLVSVIQALDVDMSSFFEDIGIGRGMPLPYLHQRASDYQPFEREAAAGFSYRHVLNQTLSDTTVEVVILDLHPNSQREPLTTDGYEYKYVLRGTVEYHIGKDTVRLQTGDSLFFDGRIPHVPINRGEEVATMLVVYLLATATQ